MAAPTIVAGGTHAERTGNGTTLAINVPTYAAGDEIYVVYVSDGDSDTATIAGGSAFTPQYSNIAMNANAGILCVWHRPAETEGATYTITSTVSERAVAVAFAVRNFGGIHATATTGSGTVTTVTAPAIVTSIADTLRVTIYGTNRNELTVGTFSGHTKQAETTFASAGTVSVQTKALATAVTDPSATITQSASGPWLTAVFAIAPTGGGGSQSITPGFIASAATVYAPTLAPGPVSITPGYIASNATVYAPTLTQTAPDQSITPGYIASGATVYAPTIVLVPAQQLAPAFIGSHAAVYAPTLTPGAVTITPGFIASAAVAYALLRIGPETATDAARIYVINAEDRRYLVLAEDRTFAVEAENRTYRIVAEDRTFAIEAESRTLVVIGDQ